MIRLSPDAPSAVIPWSVGVTMTPIGLAMIVLILLGFLSAPILDIVTFTVVGIALWAGSIRLGTYRGDDR